MKMVYVQVFVLTEPQTYNLKTCSGPKAEN